MFLLHEILVSEKVCCKNLSCIFVRLQLEKECEIKFLAPTQEEKRDAILNEVMPLIQNGNDPSKIRANVLDKKSDGSVIVQLTPRK